MKMIKTTGKIASIALALFALIGCGRGDNKGPENKSSSEKKTVGVQDPAGLTSSKLGFEGKTLEIVAVLPQASGPLAFASKSHVLITCTPPSAKEIGAPLLVWDISHGREPKLVDKLAGHNKQVWALAFSPDGKTLASAGEDENVFLWDVDDAKITHRATLSWNKGRVDSLAWTPHGKTLAASGDSNKREDENWLVRLWDVSSGKPKEGATVNAGTPMAISPDGKTLAAVWLAEIHLWDIGSAKPAKTATLTGHQKVINSLAFSPDGKTLASVGSDRTVRLWDMESKEERGLGVNHLGQVMYIAWAPNGKMFATAGETKPGRIILWDKAGKKLNQWQLAFNDIYSSHLAFSADSKLLAFPFNFPAVPGCVCVLQVDE